MGDSACISAVVRIDVSVEIPEQLRSQVLAVNKRKEQALQDLMAAEVELSALRNTIAIAYNFNKQIVRKDAWFVQTG
jgi:hypothetical protein